MLCLILCSMKRIIAFLSILTGFSSLNAQTFQDYSCEVIINNQVLANPFTGGFAAPQFSEGDFNMDGVDDIFVFDRAGFVKMVFLRKAAGTGDFDFSRTYNSAFPQMENWALVRDYNGDGQLDFFSNPSQGISGVQLHKGNFENGEWDFDVIKVGGPDRIEDIIFVEFAGNWVQVFVAFTDTPGITDIDEDGDMDIIAFEPGGSTIWYYKNLQVENGLSVDELEFEIADLCFGRFIESGVSSTIILSDDGLCAKEFKEDAIIEKSVHAGSTIMTYDENGDGAKELLIGDLTSNNMVALDNGGFAMDNWMIAQDEQFPSENISVEMPVFLGGYHVDANGDGLKDIVTSPNSISSVRNVNNSWLYLNNGDTEDAFNFVQRDFLGSQTIDLGSYSSPTFVDHNQDGVMDLVVASGGIFDDTDAEIRLYLFENQGTLSTPSFVLKDDDYLGFSEFNNTSDNPSPNFGDLDGDGDIDCLIGDENGFLYFFENTAGADNTLTFNGVRRYQYMDISVGQKARPFMVDFDQDGLMDIILGQRKSAAGEGRIGNVNFFKNIGTLGDPMFDGDVTADVNEVALGAMATRDGLNTAIEGSAAPYIYLKDGLWHFILGSRDGCIRYYTSEPGDINGQFELVDSCYGGIQEGLYTTPTLFDINNDGRLEILIGNFRGGLSFFGSDLLTDTSEIVIDDAHSVDIYPNPATDRLFIKSKKKLNLIQVFSVDGLQIYESAFTSEIDISNLEAGIYLFKAIGEEGISISKKFVKQ